MPRPKKHRVRMNITLTREANKLAREHAKETEQELSGVVSWALTQAINQWRCYEYDMGRRK